MFCVILARPIKNKLVFKTHRKKVFHKYLCTLAVNVNSCNKVGGASRKAHNFHTNYGHFRNCPLKFGCADNFKTPLCSVTSLWSLFEKLTVRSDSLGVDSDIVNTQLWKRMDKGMIWIIYRFLFVLSNSWGLRS